MFFQFSCSENVQLSLLLASHEKTGICKKFKYELPAIGYGSEQVYIHI